MRTLIRAARNGFAVTLSLSLASGPLAAVQFVEPLAARQSGLPVVPQLSGVSQPLSAAAFSEVSYFQAPLAAGSPFQGATLRAGVAEPAAIAQAVQAQAGKQ